MISNDLIKNANILLINTNTNNPYKMAQSETAPESQFVELVRSSCELNFDQLVLYGDLWHAPSEERTDEYLIQHSKTSCYHYEVGVDILAKWKDLVYSESRKIDCYRNIIYILKRF